MHKLSEPEQNYNQEQALFVNDSNLSWLINKNLIFYKI